MPMTEYHVLYRHYDVLLIWALVSILQNKMDTDKLFDKRINDLYQFMRLLDSF